FPDFNLQLARQARQAGIPVLYFIPPQLWAWRRGRMRQMARRVSRVLAVLPFERELYESAGVPVEFVGHPLLDVLPLDLSRDEARRRPRLDPSEVVVGRLPGTRRGGGARLPSGDGGRPPASRVGRRPPVPPRIGPDRRPCCRGLAPRLTRH